LTGREELVITFSWSLNSEEATMSNGFVNTVSRMFDGVANALLGKPERSGDDTIWSQDRVLRVPRR
jgi:hypothetical protein